MDEDSLKAAISEYKNQLSLLEQATLSSECDTEELQRLKADLKELISLTEGSLLSLKKSQLLSTLNTKHSCDSSAGTKADAQRASLLSSGNAEKCNRGNVDNSTDDSNEEGSNDAASRHCTGADTHHSDEHESSSDDDPEGAIESAVVGTCCRAPYTPEWGGHAYHAAAIISFEGFCDDDDDLKIRVAFLYPTRHSMVMCPFFLNGACRFDNDGQCRQSHGEVVKLSAVKEFIKPADCGQLSIGDRCLARFDDGVWYKGVVVDIHRGLNDGHETWQIMFDGYEKEEDTRVVTAEQLIPLTDDETTDFDSASSYDNGASTDDKASSETLTLPGDLSDSTVMPSTSSGDAGSWEAHTRGIASKLMSKMGYVSGQGLGRDKQGRVEPVPILRLPKGKSLDKIMQLRQRMGDVDAFDVLKQLQKRRFAGEQDSAETSKRPCHGVFDFLNHTFAGVKKARPSSVERNGSARQTGVKEISRQDLAKKSDWTLSVQMLKTDEEMKSVKRKILSLEQRLAFNESRDVITTNKLKEKLAEARTYLEKLQCSEQIMQHHQKERQNKKKLTVF